MTKGAPLSRRPVEAPDDAPCEILWLMDAVTTAFRDGYDSHEIAAHYDLPEPDVLSMIWNERRERLTAGRARNPAHPGFQPIAP